MAELNSRAHRSQRAQAYLDSLTKPPLQIHAHDYSTPCNECKPYYISKSLLELLSSRGKLECLEGVRDGEKVFWGMVEKEILGRIVCFALRGEYIALELDESATGGEERDLEEGARDEKREHDDEDDEEREEREREQAELQLQQGYMRGALVVPSGSTRRRRETIDLTYRGRSSATPAAGPAPEPARKRKRTSTNTARESDDGRGISSGPAGSTRNGTGSGAGENDNPDGEVVDPHPPNTLLPLDDFNDLDLYALPSHHIFDYSLLDFSPQNCPNPETRPVKAALELFVNIYEASIAIGADILQKDTYNTVLDILQQIYTYSPLPESWKEGLISSAIELFEKVGLKDPLDELCEAYTIFFAWHSRELRLMRGWEKLQKNEVFAGCMIQLLARRAEAAQVAVGNTRRAPGRRRQN